VFSMNRSILWLESGDGVYTPYVNNGLFLDGRLKTLKANGFIPRRAVRAGARVSRRKSRALPKRGPVFIFFKPRVKV
jgi:hypothetical protein